MKYFLFEDARDISCFLNRCLSGIPEEFYVYSYSHEYRSQ